MAQNQSQPEISYIPNLETYLRRSKERARLTLGAVLPSSFPKRVDTPSAWGPEIQNETSRWLVHFSDEEIEECFTALRYFQGLALPISHLSQANFPLRALGSKLRSCSKQVHLGTGFVVLRGFPIHRLSSEEQIILFVGVSSYIGNIRARQDQGGAAISHVTDLSKAYSGPIGNPAFTGGSQAMHTDPGEVIGMLCLSPAAEGGASRIASTTKLYNILAEKRPDLIQTLSEDWVFDGFGGTPRSYQRPLLFLGEENKLILQYIRRAFTGFGNVPRSPDIPCISEAQAEALDALHFMGFENSIQIHLQKGDFQYLNNLNMLHSRDDFRDDDTRRRHLLRIWLRDEEYGWDIPSSLADSVQWKRLFEMKMTDHSFPLEPLVKSDKFK